MPNNTKINWQGDPLAADALPANCYFLMASQKYSGLYRQIIVPAAPNYPAGTPSRYVAYLPGFPFVDGSHAMTVYDTTSNVSLTPVNTSPGANQYYNPIKGAGTNYPTNTTKEPDFIEFNSGQAGHTIDFTFYAIGSMLHASDDDVLVKTLTSSSEVNVGGELNVSGVLNQSGNAVFSSVVTINSSLIADIMMQYDTTISGRRMVRRSIIDIGAWDMNGSPTKVIDISSFVYIAGPYPTTNVIIKSITIVSDSAGVIYTYNDLSYAGYYELVLNTTTWTLTLTRNTSGIFQNINYSLTGKSRGKIMVEYWNNI